MLPAVQKVPCPRELEGEGGLQTQMGWTLKQQVSEMEIVS